MENGENQNRNNCLNRSIVELDLCLSVKSKTRADKTAFISILGIFGFFNEEFWAFMGKRRNQNPNN